MNLHEGVQKQGAAIRLLSYALQFGRGVADCLDHGVVIRGEQAATQLVLAATAAGKVGAARDAVASLGAALIAGGQVSPRDSFLSPGNERSIKKEKTKQKMATHLEDGPAPSPSLGKVTDTAVRF